MHRATATYLRGSLFGFAAVSIWAGWSAMTRLAVTSSFDAWDIPALRFGGRDHGTVDDESIGPVFRPKAARDLLLDLHHASVLLRLVVGKGNVWIGQEA